MHQPKSLIFSEFDQGCCLDELPPSQQLQYIREYLRDLEAKSVIIEPNYFDRDYLAEFSSFYAVSSRGYPNICRRFHFFALPLDNDIFRQALGGDNVALGKLQQSYLGFCVIRPIPSAPLGRTVLALYPDKTPNRPRITNPARIYKTHLAGIELSIRGLAWQQQDTAVAACATIGVWSMLHSSAFDDHHAIPTTAEITKAAHKTASLGSRIFPSVGLSIYQLAEAIKEHDLSPVICQGDIQVDGQHFFSKERFSGTCAAFIRSGYPVLVIGPLDGHGPHAQCMVGFRDAPDPLVPPSSGVGLFDAGIEHIYIHDDNLGPNVRFRVCENDKKQVYLKADPPPPLYGELRQYSPTENYFSLWPQQLIVAVHNDLRTSPDQLHRAGLIKANLLNSIFMKLNSVTGIPLVLGSRFIRLTDYLGCELERLLASSPECLSRVRLQLQEGCPPMSLHLGLVRISLADSTPLLDVLFDTTDSDRNHPAYAHLNFSELAAQIVDEIIPNFSAQIQPDIADFGIAINAF